uniref:Uncharacterized protein n=1 Tax=Rhizophora mucronata TaxID=61149 RepID=A0A2P2PUG3_RHIMU
MEISVLKGSEKEGPPRVLF